MYIICVMSGEKIPVINFIQYSHISIFINFKYAYKYI